MALASFLRWRRKRLLGSRLWPLLLGFTYVLGLLLGCHALPGIPIPTRTSRLFGYGYVYMSTVTPPLTFGAGTIGFLASYWAVRRLYSAIRID